jgi:hypothetical protein
MVVSGCRPKRSRTVTPGARGQRWRTSRALLAECGHVHGVGSDHRLCPVRASWQRSGLSHLATSSRLLPRVRELGKLGVLAVVYELPTAHAEVWSAVCSLPKRQQGDPNLQPLRGRRPLGSLRPEDRALDGRHGEDDQREYGQGALNDHEGATVTLVPDIAGEVPQPVDDDRF